MKKTLVGIIISLVCILSFCQERIDTDTSLHFNKTTKSLKNVIGYNHYDGKWYSKKNSFQYNYFSDAQEFKSLIVKTFVYNDTLYYALIKNHDKYVERYSKLRLGGEYINENMIYLFTAPEFEQIFHLDKTAKFIYSFKDIVDYNAIDIPNYLLTSANKAPKNKSMEIRIADDGNMVRFLLPDNPKEMLGEYDWLKSSYFEMPLKKFYDWLNPVAPQK